jgi:two-component system, sensor histidine kinase and response regulator
LRFIHRAFFQVKGVSMDVLVRGENLQILLAEDNFVNRRLAVRLLEKHGHTVVAVNNGQEAVAALAAQRFDLVLMDIQMSVLDGFEATAQIRAQERITGTRTPIVAVAANVTQVDREQCLAAGMDGYVPQPIQMAELFRVMMEVAPVAMRKPELSALAPLSWLITCSQSLMLASTAQ